jgi:putative PIG3 family NAD(P)H quinone oxidoreductase
MRAITSKTSGGPEVLQINEVAQPVPEKDELLVQVKAAGINRADILQRKGLYPPPPGTSDLLGLEISGVIAGKGEKCQDWKLGQRIFGLLNGGGYAEYAVIHQDLAMPIPDHFSFEEAAAIPEAFLTAYQAISWLGKLKGEEKILVHAGASGVGTAATQLARAMEAQVIVTAGSDQKVAYCKKLGAKHAINYKTTDFETRVLDETAGEGVDLVLDFIGEPYWNKNLNVLSTDGRLVILATMGGSMLTSFDLRKLMKKRLTVSGSTLRNRDLSYKIQLTREFAKFALPRFSEKKLLPVIDKIFSWERVAEAHRYMEEDRNIGKIILTVS